MTLWAHRDPLYELWNTSVEPHPVLAVMEARQARGDDQAETRIQHALTLPGPQAATSLMEAVAEAFPWKDLHRRNMAHQALSALVRAGGDPTEVLPAIIARLDIDRERRAASRLLRTVALRGWPIPETAFRPSVLEHDDVRAAWRLARLQRVRPDSIGLFASVYRAHRVSNLFPGVAMVEEGLLSEDPDLASDTLVSLANVGADLFAAWVALLPILTRGLGVPEERQRAARTLMQVRFSFEDSEDRKTKGAISERVRPTLAPLAAGLCDGTPTAQACAEALSVLAELGADLHSLRPQLEAATTHASVQVREHVSHALSQWLRAIGAEAALPPRCSHRRIFAASDDRIEGNHRSRCVACEGEATPIYHREDISQTHADIRLEVRCHSCGLYSWHSWGY